MPRPKKSKTVPVDRGPSAQLLAEKHPMPTVTTTKTKLLDDSDPEQEFHSAQQSPAEDSFRINEEYAQRFEHNKKREELHKLEEKFGKGSKKRAREEDDDDSEDDSSSEDEDDVGVLATEALDQEIFATLAAIRNKDPRVYDGKTSFYTPIAETASTSAADGKKEKPMYLRDYHRENLLAGRAGEDDEQAIGEAKSFVQQQDELKRTVIKEMHTAAEADVSSDEDNDEFLIRKPGINEQEKGKAKQDPLNPSLADKDPEEFLNKFLTSRAWTQPSSTAHVPIESDDSEDDAVADAFEYSYNMRFEDPDATARAKLVSYGRDVVNANTVRREEKSQRKRAREEKRRRKEEEKSQRETEKGRLKKLKAGELMEKFKLVKEAADLNSGDDEAEAAVLSKLLEGDFSDGEWNRWMEERFGDKYYDKEGRPKKPKFEDDIDIGDIDSEFEDEVKKEEEEEDENAEHLDMDGAFQAPDEGSLGDEDRPERKSRKELTKERQAQKAKERSTRRKVERFLEDNYDFGAELPSSSKSTGFRYRETTPETYGLGTLDILAADDADLNSYAGLKKYAAFRDKEKKKRDKKRYAKKKLLKQWRKEVFGDPNGVQMPADWKPEGLVKKEGEAKAEAGKVDIKESGGGGRKKKRKKSKSRA